ncbi:MAG: hypothetical protein SOZ58_06900 [Prevotella sp.]|nr:hypothetical protein [Prevotella sp.]
MSAFDVQNVKKLNKSLIITIKFGGFENNAYLCSGSTGKAEIISYWDSDIHVMSGF